MGVKEPFFDWISIRYLSIGLPQSKGAFHYTVCIQPFPLIVVGRISAFLGTCFEK